MSKEINIILNGKNVKGQEGETILSLARRHNISIPTLCHDDRLKPFSSCFVCVVQVEGMRGMQPSCSTLLREGMVVNTENDKVKKARKTALDLLLSNHYADCEAPCKQTCPAGVDVQGYISLVEKGLYHQAIALIKETNPLPAICGRVCVRPCEVACNRNFLDEEAPVGIDYLKRFAADKDMGEDHYKPAIEAATGKKIAIIGAGPAGLSAAFFLQRKGHQCDIYEAQEHAGGWLRYGIPEYRLPNDVLDKEVEAITELGVNIFYNKRLGQNVQYAQLNSKYDSVLLAIGSQKGTLIGCEGDDAENVFSGIDFLRQMETTGERYDFTDRTVAVVGGGNTAMDCCRTSLRCGAEKVYVIYRRTEKEMPANPIEIHESKLEGVEYLFLTNPVKVNKDKNGKLKSMTCIRMELGEPDASGRRRPVPVEGTEFDLELDYVLAAIGQKTQVNFLETINKQATDGQLKLNRWGDIDANEQTLQTDIPGVFAAGDGVTGPATIIEAVAQARTASRSIHQFLTGESLHTEKKEFISRRDNFRELTSTDFVGKFQHQERHEMPVLPADKRQNFKEVELGYTNEQMANEETARCLECGCSAFYTCDLKAYSTEYQAEQKHYAGDFHEYGVDATHPYVEIDNNKCILCGRCIRICKEHVGANALGFVERGFDTYVAPSMGESLLETPCESCGLCISTCPTGAITENKPFKPGPIKLEEVHSLCHYCGVGCEVNYSHKDGFIWRADGKEGMINANGNICRFPKFGYTQMNDAMRITKPLLKVDGKFEEISFEKAFEVMADEMKGMEPNEQAFFAGARLSNEEQYLFQKLARKVVGTNNISSFHYLGREQACASNFQWNIRLDKLKEAKQIVVVGARFHQENAVVGFQVNNARQIHGAHVTHVRIGDADKGDHKADEVLAVNSYSHFLRAIAHYLLSNNRVNPLFIKDQTTGFEAYKKAVLADSYESLIEAAMPGGKEIIEKFAEHYYNIAESLLVVSEHNTGTAAIQEAFHLAALTGKLGKTASGILVLKEKNNAQGLFDMGVTPHAGVGGVALSNTEYQTNLKKVWQVEDLPVEEADLLEILDQGQIKHVYIAGEDPLGCAKDKERVEKWLADAEFVMVQEYFLTETANRAHLILPASFPVEADGSFTNAQRNIQVFEKQLKGAVDIIALNQWLGILRSFGEERSNSADEVREELLSLLPEQESDLFTFQTKVSEHPAMFEYGADALHKSFERNFSEEHIQALNSVQQVRVEEHENVEI
jgi:formate dehydrogenase major subunit